jgi:hypothetical protein
MPRPSAPPDLRCNSHRILRIPPDTNSHAGLVVPFSFRVVPIVHRGIEECFAVRCGPRHVCIAEKIELTIGAFEFTPVSRDQPFECI